MKWTLLSRLCNGHGAGAGPLTIISLITKMAFCLAIIAVLFLATSWTSAIRYCPLEHTRGKRRTASAKPPWRWGKLKTGIKYKRSGPFENFLRSVKLDAELQDHDPIRWPKTSASQKLPKAHVALRAERLKNAVGNFG